MAASVAASADEDWTALVAGHNVVHLEQPVGYRNSSGTRYETAPSRMLVHLAMHGEHHRGQIARTVREEGGEPAVTDLIVFLLETASA